MALAVQVLHTAKPEPGVVKGYLADPSEAALAKLLLDPAISWAPFDVLELDAKAALVPMTEVVPVVPATGPLTTAAYGEVVDTASATASTDPADGVAAADE